MHYKNVDGCETCVGVGESRNKAGKQDKVFCGAVDLTRWRE